MKNLCAKDKKQKKKYFRKDIFLKLQYGDVKFTKKIKNAPGYWSKARVCEFSVYRDMVRDYNLDNTNKKRQDVISSCYLS